MQYFYAPIFTEEDGVKNPGKLVSDEVVSALAETPPCTQVLTMDDSRFVFQIPDPYNASAPSEWENKSKAEVNTDYPGLIP